MSDFYDDQDDREDESRRRRRRNIDSEAGDEEGWGMAYDVDAHDHDPADAEDYAAGLVEEENIYFKDSASLHNTGGAIPPHQPLGNRSGRPAIPPPNAPDYRLLEGESPALQRANQLRTRYTRGGRKTSAAPTDNVSVRQTERTDRNMSNGDFFDTLFNFQFGSLPSFSLGAVPQYLVLLGVVLIFLLFGCVIAAWITAIEVRDMLGLTSYLILGK